jgi:hypothetical protein
MWRDWFGKEVPSTDAVDIRSLYIKRRKIEKILPNNVGSPEISVEMRQRWDSDIVRWTVISQC